MKIKLIDNEQDFLRLKECWNKILQVSYADFPFLTFEWLSSWWKSFGKGKKLMVLTANKNGTPHGIAPLIIDKSAGFRILKFIGTGRSDFLDFIIKDEIDDTIKAFFTFLNKHNESWDLILLSDILMDGGSAQRIGDIAKSIGWRVSSRLYYYSPYLPINGEWSEYLSSKSRNFRRNLKRETDCLQKEGLKLKIQQFNSNYFDQSFHDMVEIEKNSWKNDSGTPNMQDDQSQKFFIDYLQNFAKKGWMNVWIGYLNDAPAAYLITFDYKGNIWFYNVAYHKDYRKYGIGAILLHRAVEDAFTRGKTECNFMRSNQAYKERWTSQKRESYQVVFYKKSLRSVLGYLFLIRLRWFLSKSRKIQQARLYFIGIFNNLKKVLRS